MSDALLKSYRCSKVVLQKWLTAVFTTEPDDENTLAFNLLNQSKDFDIRVNHLSISRDPADQNIAEYA
jgi:hypothetical protein